MLRKRFVFALVLGLLVVATAGAAATAETERLILRDLTGQIAPERLARLGVEAEATLSAVQGFWAADPRTRELGRIVIEYEPVLPGDVATSFLVPRQEQGREVRVIRVFGSPDRPRQLAHKLTTALFRHPDILVRNLMGEVSERRFGNPLSFPRCGFDVEAWVQVLLEAGAYLPLADAGTEQEDWGKEIVAQTPRATDRIKQHTLYLEAGGFGEYLVRSFGVGAVKRFYRLSRSRSRPWEAAFGAPLPQLEARWHEALKETFRERRGEVATLARLWQENASTACYRAQELAAKNP